MLWYRSVLTQSTKGGTPLIRSDKLTQNVFWYSEWFLGCSTIGFNGFQWFGTIARMMEWFQWIVQIYNHSSMAESLLQRSETLRHCQ